MAQKHSERETREGGCGSGDGIHMGAVGGMQGGMRQEQVEWVYLKGARVQVVLVGVANANVTGSIRLDTTVVAGSHGKSTKAR